MMRYVACALLGALAALCAAWRLQRPPERPAPRPRASERAVLEVLRSERLAFLATDRIVAQAAVEREESHPLLGSGQAWLLAVVRLHVGVDLSELDASSVERRGDEIRVALPEPKLLACGVDLSTVRYISKRSGLLAIRDWLSGADHERGLREAFQQTTLRFAEEEGLMPTREQVAARLNEFTPALEAALGARVVFR